jgi:hypothetical protein
LETLSSVLDKWEVDLGAIIHITGSFKVEVSIESAATTLPVVYHIDSETFTCLVKLTILFAVLDRNFQQRFDVLTTVDKASVDSKIVKITFGNKITRG